VGLVQILIRLPEEVVASTNSFFGQRSLATEIERTNKNGMATDTAELELP
jgi:hypothetical protein